MAEPQYWVVGASWGGKEHHDAEWVKLGIWILGWDEGPQFEKAQQIRPGDRIAIKRMKGKGKGKGSGGIKILHLGIIRGIIPDTDRPTFTVDWVATNLDRDVADGKGCFDSIRGPFDPNDEWTQQVFCL